MEMDRSIRSFAVMLSSRDFFNFSSMFATLNGWKLWKATLSDSQLNFLENRLYIDLVAPP